MNALYKFQTTPRPLGVGQAIAESISCLLPEMAVAMPKILHLSIFGIHLFVCLTCMGCIYFLFLEFFGGWRLGVVFFVRMKVSVVDLVGLGQLEMRSAAAGDVHPKKREKATSHVDIWQLSFYV